MEKNDHTLVEALHTGEDLSDQLMRTAYGLKGLGLPLKGLKDNIENINANVLQKFQLENVDPNRIFVCAAGIQNHQEFVDLVQEKLGFIQPNERNSKQREKSEYIGGEIRVPNQEYEMKLALAFKSVHLILNIH